MLKISFKHMVIAGIIACTLSINAFAANDAGAKVKWGYTGNDGPSHWAKLSPHFSLCQKGKEQSPVNILKETAVSKNALKIHYLSAPMVILDDGETNLMIGHEQTIINDGHTIQLNFPKKSLHEFITFQGKKYRLIQFHLHVPAENQIAGKSFPFEIHFVHQGENGILAVIAVLASTGKANAYIDKIIKHMPRKPGKEKVIKGERINPLNFLPTEHDYYHFPGSLTTPPCSEGVQWLVMKNTITISADQIKKLKTVIKKENARPLQHLNGRKIGYSKTH